MNAGIWAWDTDNSKWIKVLVDDTGRLRIVAEIDHLNDIGDVYVPTPTDGYIIYWNASETRWECKAAPAGAWADITGKPTSPSLEELATEHEADGTHGNITPTSCSIRYTDALALAQAKANIEDTPVDGHTEQGISSNWAYDHKEDGSAHQSNIVGIEFTIDGGGSVITTGLKMGFEIPFAGTITQATLIGVLPADTAGSIVIDVWKTTYAAAPPKDANSITASAPPTITADKKSQDSTLTGWTTAIAAGDILFINVDSCATFTAVTLILRVTKT